MEKASLFDAIKFSLGLTSVLVMAFVIVIVILFSITGFWVIK